MAKPVTTTAEIRAIAIQLERLHSEEAIFDRGPADKFAWSPAGLRELANLRDELEARKEIDVFNGPYKRADRLPVDAYVIWDGEICKLKKAEFVENDRSRVKVWLQIQYQTNPQEIVTTVNREYEFRTVIIGVRQ